MQRSPDVTTPVREKFLSFQPPAVDEEEIEAVSETLRSGWLTSGPRAAELEARFAELTGARHAVAVASGTAALHLSLVAAGIGPGDEVITSPITWPATANVMEHAGARPIFCDVRDSDLNIDADLLPGVARSARGPSCPSTSRASRATSTRSWPSPASAAGS